MKVIFFIWGGAMSVYAHFAAAMFSSGTGTVYGRQIEVVGEPFISGSPYPSGTLRAVELPVAIDADESDSHAGWRYVWQKNKIDLMAPIDVSSVGLDSVPGLVAASSYIGSDIRLCVQALSSSGYPESTKVSDAACSKEVKIVAQAAPVAQSVKIDGALQVGGTLTGSYTYFDADGDSENNSTLQWFRADNVAGTLGKILVGSGATYALNYLDRGKYIVFEVTPRASSGYPVVGNTAGAVTGRVSEVLFLNHNGSEFALPYYYVNNWGNANKVCSDYVSPDGHKNWRLASKLELERLYSRWPNNQLNGLFGLPTHNRYWTSTSHPNSSSAMYYVWLDDGYVGYFEDVGAGNGSGLSLCVRF